MLLSIGYWSLEIILILCYNIITMKKTTKIKILSLFILLTLLATTGFRCKWMDQATKEALKPITLTYWRVWDDQDAFQEIIEAYRQIHPNITIEYKKFRYEEYEKELLNALAEDRGPDIFSIHNTWVNKYQSKIKPLPKEITMAYQVTKGTIKKETYAELRTSPTLSLRSLKDNFVDVVYSDAVMADNIYGLPLSVDTLALFYNRDLWNNGGIPELPKFWDQFQKDVQNEKLTIQNKQGNFIQSAAAIGTGSNVVRSFDLISVLMMQNGTQMTDEYNRAFFDKMPKDQSSRDIPPGEQALIFYTDFASPAKISYIWNSKMPDSLNAFAQGKTVVFFGYSYNLPNIKALAPKLNFDVAKLPQVDGNPEINYANYWLETVSDKSQHPNEAWDFIQFATQAENAAKYLAKAKKPTALRSLVNSQLEDMDLSAFASQVLTAKSWYRGQDTAAAEKIFTEMIDSVLNDSVSSRQAVNLAAKKIDQTYR